jgi:mono/diheme cytochrome c family protein
MATALTRPEAPPTFAFSFLDCTEEDQRMLRRIVLGLFVVVTIAVVAVAIFVASRQNLKFDAPYPEVVALSDSSVIARGRYVVRDVAPCQECHGAPAQLADSHSGAEIPLSGGHVFDIPPGRFHVPNITPDPETGIGRFNDGAIARALRSGIGHDGRALLPFMEMQGLSDEDLTAVVSYLRAQAPVNHFVPAHEYSLLGRVIRATVLANPVGPAQPPPAASPRGATVENGRYLVESVALCGACHTQRDDKTGAFTGPHLGGATGFKAGGDAARTWSPPNITNEPATGRLAKFTEDEVVARERAGRAIPGSPMPWQGYQRMNEDDLRAMYRYLQTVPPAVHDVGPAVVEIK